MINYFKGDLLRSDCNIICHQVNCQGVMGGGIARQIKEEYPTTFLKYYTECKKAKEEDYSLLGTVLPTYEKDENEYLKIICNCFSQDKYGRTSCYTDYGAVVDCFYKVKKFATTNNSMFINGAKIGIPYKYGCGLAGGDWNKVKKIIGEVFSDYEGKIEIWEFDG